ncbi:MAG: hypothetical protein WDZ49_07700 [Litorilinea sp.]
MPTIGETINRVMRLDRTIFLDYMDAPHGLWLALVLVTLAGASKALGQSVILFINRVRPLRFALALIIGVIQYVGGFLVWTTSLWLVGTYGFETSATWSMMAIAVGVAYAPQTLAFFELTPFFGNGFGFLLSLWSLLAIVMGVQIGLGLTLGQAVLASGLGWLLLQIWVRTLGRPFYALGRWIETRIVDAPHSYTWRDLPTLRRRSAIQSPAIPRPAVSPARAPGPAVPHGEPSADD